MSFFGALAGYLTGTVLALILDRLYTGAALGGPLRLCVAPRPDFERPDDASPVNHSGSPVAATALPAGSDEDGTDSSLAAAAAGAARRPEFVDERVPWYVFSGTLGYLLARGRCPSGRRLAARLWYLPLLGLGAGSMIVLRATDARHGALTALFSVFLLAFVGTDFERHLLPNRLMYPALALGIALSWAWPDGSAVSSLAGGAAGFGIMFVLFLVLPGFGFGDVKLSGLLGLVSGLGLTLPALAIGAIAGGVGAALMMLFRRAGRRTTIAYGPYLALGAFIGMLSR